MSIKLTAQQKSKPIYTEQDAMRTAWPSAWDIIHPIHMWANKICRKKDYAWIYGASRKCCLNVTGHFIINEAQYHSFVPNWLGNA